MKTADVASVLASLDAGSVIECGHDYLNANFFKLPKDNRYGNHVFAIFKAGPHYFVAQGYLRRYRSSIVAHTRREIGAMLTRIITELCDYEGVKTWADIDGSAYKAIFLTELRLHPDVMPSPKKRVHKIVLFYKTWANPAH